MNNFKKNKIIILILLIILLMGIKIININAYNDEFMIESDYISNIYIKIVNKDKSSIYQQARFIKSSSNNEFVYCIEPFLTIDNNYKYDKASINDSNVLDLSEDVINKIILYSYYGYLYNSHIEDKWYAITQVMIWRTILPDSNVGFSKSLNLDIDESLFLDEINELESLVNNHLLVPSFINENIKINVGENIILEDKFGVLENFDISSNSHVSITYDHNNLYIKGINSGNFEIVFSKSSNMFENNPILYYSPYTQNTISIGNFTDVILNLDIEVISGSLKLIKLDKNTNSNNSSSIFATLENAKYAIFDEYDNLITYLYTNNSAEAVVNDLALGKYYLKEIQAPKGYLLDENEYFFEITEDELDVEIVVYEEIISNKIELKKFYKNYYDSNLYPEEDIIFDIYDSNNQKVTSVITNDDGIAFIDLEYGEYTIKQYNTKENYEIGDDFTIIVDNNINDIITYELINHEIVSYLNIVKKDASTSNVINIAGIKFKIYDLTNNNYICNNIECEFKTDEYGIAKVDVLLSMGRYLIEEVDQFIEGYVVNNTKLELNLNIDNDYDFINSTRVLEVDFYNQSISTQVNIKKYGEVLLLDSNGYYYDFSLLEDVEFKLYANDDIYSSNNEQIYKKDEFIETYKTSKDGQIKIDNLTIGQYYLIETKTNSTYILDESKLYFDLYQENSNNEVIRIELEVYNYLEKGILEFTKLDEDTNLTLESTLIGIYNNLDDIIYIGHTNSNGQIILNDLIPGQYYLKELVPLSGYCLNEEIIEFEIKTDEVTSLIMYNKLIQIPDTLSNNYNNISMIILFILLINLYKFGKKIMIFLTIMMLIVNINYKEFNNFITIDDSIAKNVIELLIDFNIKFNKEKYINYIQIPKIELKQPLYFNDYNQNNVDLNIEVISGSNMPDYIGGNLILAAHSGNGSNAYFNDLDKLNLGDCIYLKYNNNEYIYNINDIYYQEKNGKLDFTNNYSYTNLILITCSLFELDKQLVITANLIN